jgi:Doubled CXXCH motif (Paired_CXXCH_1)/Cytochrome c554 and c-prime
MKRMSRPSLAVVTAAIVFAGWLAVWLPGARIADAEQASPAPPTASPSSRPAWDESTPGYVGSKTCALCHTPEYNQWHRSLHVQMTKPIAEAQVEGDFRPGTHFEAYGRAYTMSKSDGHYYISVSLNGGPPTKYEVDYTLGARRFQGYLSKQPDGRIYVLPVFWHRLTQRWIDWSEITPIPKHYTSDIRQIWNSNCVNCHAVNLAPNYDVATRTFKTTWTEMGVGCEACHGPGAAHVALMKQWDANPSLKPHYDPSADNRDLSGILHIFAARTATPRQVLDACGYCHGNKTNYFLGFKPGDLMENYALPFLISEPIPPNDPQGEFWPDGRPSRFNRPQAVMDSQCFLKGGASCISCHVAHGSRWNHSLKLNIDVPGRPGEHSRQSDQLCTQCHKSFTTPNPAGGSPISHSFTDDEGITAHTHHPAASQGSRCINCHMADVNWRLLTRRLDHTFLPPVPEMTAGFGEPNACTTCHDDKTPEWAESALDRWYHNKADREMQLKVADAMYRAGSGDVSALADVARLAVNRAQPPVIRASAAAFTGRLIWAIESGAQGTAAPPGTKSGQAQSAVAGAVAAEPSTAPPPAPATGPAATVPPWVVNALIGASADPEPLVRAVAVQALGLTGDRRVTIPLISHLDDPARIVRVNVAQSLLQLGVARLNGAPGAQLARAQDEYAESLSTFKDGSEDHTSLGWLDAERGQVTAATEQLQTAVGLDPTSARPHIYLGVIAARAGRYQDAIKEWERAKVLDKENSNIDRLITEARKMMTSGPGHSHR